MRSTSSTARWCARIGPRGHRSASARLPITLRRRRRRSAIASRACRPKAGSACSTRSTPTASTSPWRSAAARPARVGGGVEVEAYVIAYDIGRAINPALVKGQIVGGFTQGLGGALLEEFTYNERGDPLATTFADYLMPTVRETPEVEVILREEYTSP